MPSHHYAEDPEIRLNAHGMLAGWVFGVPEVFFGALDIRPQRVRLDREDRARTVWLRGVPPVRSFKAGDVFYDPPEVRKLQWAAALRRLKRWLQVLAATEDRWSPAGGGGVVPGSVTFTVIEYANGAPASTHPAMTVTQAAFEHLLRTGAVP